MVVESISDSSKMAFLHIGLFPLYMAPKLGIYDYFSIVMNISYKSADWSACTLPATEARKEK